MKIRNQVIFFNIILCLFNTALITNLNANSKIFNSNLNHINLNQDKNIAQKKKILIFSSKGGGGHASVSAALEKYLNKDYSIKVINIFEEILTSLDPIKSFSNGKYDGESFYNLCLRERMTSFLNMFTYVGAWKIRQKQDDITGLVQEYCEKYKPDMLISVVPLINRGLLDAAQKQKIPFIIVTNDLDTTQYINNIYNPDYKHFYYTLAFNEPMMLEKIAEVGIKPDNIKFLGFPLRADFYDTKNKEALKKEFNIPKDKFVVMLLAGGNGSIANYRYTKLLSRLNLPMHIIICAGNNTKLKSDLENLNLPDSISLTVMGYTTRISDLMSMSDLLITKPGPNSIIEAITCELPMILDQTCGILWWEQLNVDFVNKYGFGQTVQHFKQFKSIASKLIKDQEQLKSIKRNMAKIKPHKFEYKIQKLIKYAFARLD